VFSKVFYKVFTRVF